MVLNNITYLLNNFLHCSAYQNVIFCWVMHEQSIIDSIMSKLDVSNCDVKVISLTVDEKILRERLQRDVLSGIRNEDVIERSVQRIPLYQQLDTVKIDTGNRSITAIASEIAAL